MRQTLLLSLCVLVLRPLAPASAVGPYIVTDLGVLPNYYEESYALGINSFGQVVGYSRAVGAIVRHAAFLWTPDTPNGTTGTTVNIGTLVPRKPFEDDYIMAYGINEQGQITGYGDTGFPWRGFLWTPTLANGTTGSMVSLGVPNQPFGVRNVYSYAINSFGQTVGYFDAPGLSPSAFLWTPDTPNGSSGSMVALPELPNRSDYNIASAINSFGQVTGNSSSFTAGHRAFLWTPNSPNGDSGSVVDLGPLSDVYGATSGLGINSYGQVAGIAFGGPGGFGTRGFLWTPASANDASGIMIDIGYLPDGNTSTTAYAVNSLGHVVGESTVGVHPGQQYQDYHAIIWIPTTPNSTTGTVHDLQQLLDPVSGAGWTVVGARGINDRGQIVGYGVYDPSGSGSRFVARALLLTPVPEPSACAAACCVAVLILMSGPLRRRDL